MQKKFLVSLVACFLVVLFTAPAWAHCGKAHSVQLNDELMLNQLIEADEQIVVAENIEQGDDFEQAMSAAEKEPISNGNVKPGKSESYKLQGGFNLSFPSILPN